MALAIAAAPAVAAPAVASGTAPLADDSLSLRSFHADMTLDRDDSGHSTLSVTETIVADFPDADKNHGVTRSIPLTVDGVDLHTDVTSVTDASGSEVPYTSADEGEGLFLVIGDENTYLHGEQTFTISYLQRDVVRAYGNTDSQELYRDINGTRWGLPFDTVTVDVTLGDSLSGALTGNLACYTGAEGSTDSECSITREAGVVSSSTGHLDPRENLTIAVGFENGTFVAPEGATPSFLQIVTASLPWILLGVVVVLAGWVLWWRSTRWRDAPGRGTIVPQYTPPEGICALEAAEILRRRKKGFAAQLVAFAVSGVATLSENRGAPRTRRYSLTVTDPDAVEKLEPMERNLLLAIVGTIEKDRTVVLDTRSRTIGNRLALRRRDAKRSLVTERLFEAAPQTPQTVTRIPLIVASIASILLTPFSAVAIGLTLTVLTVLATIALSFFVYRRLAEPRPRLTPEGALVREQLDGLRMYMRLAEADRIRYLQAPDTAQRIDVTDEHAVVKLHEKLLPYAIVWGLEEKWISALETESATTDVPQWFTGSELVRVSALSSAFATGGFATAAAASATAGAPLAGGAGVSSVGGSMGGGFSGGGGGGGGGGGW